MPKHKFRVELAGSFYTYELYDERGREIFDASKAAEAAEEMYPGEWRSVYNGSESIDNENL